MQASSKGLAPGLLVYSFVAGLTATVFFGLRDVVGLPIANAVIAAVVFVQGVFVLKAGWNLELGGRFALPFATTFMGIQHIAFGLGGILVTFFNEGFDYENAQGLFGWAPAVTRFLILHGLSLNISLLGIWLAAAPPLGNRVHQRMPLHWDFLGPLCMVTLSLHGPCWLLPDLVPMPGPLKYALQSFGQCTLGAYVLWGLAWRNCRAKKVFIVYNFFFISLFMIEGHRTVFIFPIFMFALGYLIAAPVGFFKLGSLLRWTPLVLLLFFVFVKTDDLRTRFTRGAPTNFAEAMDRLSFMVGDSVDGSGTAIGVGDGSGREMNSMFRIGSRLFELSAADVISRTPEEFPFWGWTEEDTSVLVTGFLPLKLNPDAVANTCGTANVLFLQSYGWTQVDPKQGNSMPATVLADSWRRFGWLGVILTYVVLAWLLTKFTLAGVFIDAGDFKAIFFTAFTCNMVFQYTTDITTLVSATPRRIAVTVAYSLLVQFIASFQARRKRASVRRVSLYPASSFR